MSDCSCNCIKIECIEDPAVEVHTPTRDYLYIKEEPFEWLVYDAEDWEAVGDTFRLVIPISDHKCSNPYITSMGIGSADEGVKYDANLPTWYVLSNDSVVITSDDAVACRILIKGDR